jgi:hypothetical protein
MKLFRNIFQVRAGYMFMVTVLAFALLFTIILHPIDDKNRDLVNVLIGLLIGSTISPMIAYYYKQDRNSEMKTYEELASQPPLGGKRAEIQAKIDALITRINTEFDLPQAEIEMLLAEKDKLQEELDNLTIYDKSNFTQKDADGIVNIVDINKD